MKRSNDSVVLGLGAIGVAMFSFGFSITSVACSAKSASEARPEPKAAAAAPIATAAKTPPAAAPVVASANASAPAAQPEQKSTLADRNGGLRLKRLVVTERIVGREPVAVTSLSAGSGPIYAFAELENTSEQPQKIRITFEHPETKATVGHAELEIPGNRPRFRTWGNTRNIREPGHWEAVVRTEDGRELARTGFDIESS